MKSMHSKFRLKISDSLLFKLLVCFIILSIQSRSNLFSMSEIFINATIFQQTSQPQVVVKQNESGKWGYQITRDSKLLISQFHIPAIEGKKYFQDSIDAKKVGDLVKKIMMESNTFPSISIDDLKKLNIKL